MSGILQFSLGLTAGGFASAIAGADSKLKSFIGHTLSMPGVGVAVGGLIGSFASLHAVVEGVMGAIEKGGALEDLSKRTGVAVGELYSLQKGFAAAGLEAGDVGSTLFMMQRALGGVNEMGESTADIFSQLGLDVAKLKDMTGPEQLLQIMERINRLDQTSAAAAASKIFGRGQAGNMIQLARSSKEFATALQASAEQAAIFQRNAKAFENVERSLAKLRGKANGFFAGLAEGVAPGIQAITSALNKIDLTGIGVELGKILTAVGQAFKEGSLGELIGETFKLGFELALAYALPIFEKMGIALLRVFSGPLTYLQAGMTHAFTRVIWRAEHPEEARKLDDQVAGITAKYRKPGILGMSSAEHDKMLAEIKDAQDKAIGESWEQTKRETYERGVQFSFGGEGMGLGEMAADANARAERARKSMEGPFAKWKSMFDGLNSRARAAAGSGDEKSGGTGKLNLDPDQVKPAFTELEKMGFVMGGLNNPALDYARRTSQNTGRLVEIMEQSARQPVGAGGEGTIDNS